MIYKFKPGFRTKLDPQEVGNELERIRLENEGSLHEENVLEEAKKKRSPIHEYFDWDDESAANKQRLEAARQLIAAIVVKYKGVEQDMRYYVSIKRHDDEAACYMPTEIVLADDNLKEKLFVRALSELQSFERKYKNLEELSEIFKAIRVVASRKVVAKAG